MKKDKKYRDIKFTPSVISEAWHKLLGIAKAQDVNTDEILTYLTVEYGEITWKHDNDDEFFADYMNPQISYAHYSKDLEFTSLEVDVFGRDTTVRIGASRREDIEAVFRIFEDKVAESTLPPIVIKKENPKIFIGHGGDEQWRDLKDHLQDKHMYQIEAYEVGARAGHEIRDVLASMLNKSSFAVLVMTGEDKGLGGKIYPRANVVHELGLFQGKLGFSRAIVLLEEGTETFSNINGVSQIRYPKGGIKETFGEVLATLKRELGS